MLKALRECKRVGCRALTRGTYCLEHVGNVANDTYQRHKEYDKHRDPRSDKFYHSGEWKKASNQAMIRDHFICQRHLKNKKIVSAEMVHHIIPIKIDWSKRLDLDNLVCLCDSCHAEVEGNKL